MKLEVLLSKLIEQQTLTNRSVTNKSLLKWIRSQLKNLDLHAEEHVSLEHSSLIITTQKTRAPKIWLQAHVDVVPGSIEMFRPKIKRGRLYGRGAYDMKFAVACYIKLLLELEQDLKNYNFGVMLTSDEETGGFNGVKYLLDEGFESEVCVLPDAGLDWSLEEQAKGLIHLKIIAEGMSGHAAHPWDAKNAAHLMNNFLNDLKKVFKKGNASKSAYRTTCSITNLQTSMNSGGINQIPDIVEATVDIRPASHSDRIKMDKLLEKLSAKHKDIKIDILAEADPYKINLKNNYVKAWNEVARKHNRLRKGTVRSYGSSDARFFAEKAITTIATRPKGGGLHSEEEWIDLKDLEVFYTVLKDFVKDAARI